MKTIIVSVLLSLSLSAVGQGVLQIYGVASGPWNPYREEYDLQYRQTSITAIIDNSVIRVNDEAHSVYITRNARKTKDDREGYIVKWDAVDEKSRDCAIFLGADRLKGEYHLVVQYNDYMFVYHYYQR